MTTNKIRMSDRLTNIAYPIAAANDFKGIVAIMIDPSISDFRKIRWERSKHQISISLSSACSRMPRDIAVLFFMDLFHKLTVNDKHGFSPVVKQWFATKEKKRKEKEPAPFGL